MTLTACIAAGAAEHEKHIFPLLREDNVEYVIGTVTQLTNTSATVSTGAVINFDVAVVCTGHKIPIFMPDPEKDTTLDLRKAAVSAANDNIRRANHIVIAGGGSVGVETAADIKLRFKEKSVTVVHSHSSLLHTMSPQFPPLIARFLESKEVNIILGDRVTSVVDGKARLKSGKEIPCDLFIEGHAKGGNTSFVPRECVDANGYLKVNDQFIVEGLPHVLGGGDVTTYNGQKSAAALKDRTPTLLFNVEAVANGRPPKNYVKGWPMGQASGPLLVALGHGLPDGYGVGPDLPGCCCSTFCFVCCCCGPPCSHPAGAGVAKTKSDFNNSITPKKGKGMSD